MATIGLDKLFYAKITEDADGKYRYFWIFRVKFGIPSTSLETKGDSISFQTPSIEGTVMRRNRLDAQGKYPWKVEVTEGTPGTKPSVIAERFDAVYEPIFHVWRGL